MSWLEFIADMAGHVAWPIAIVVLALAFRSKVDELLPRITKIGSSGVELSLPKQSTEASGELQSEEISDTKLVPLRDDVALSIERRNKEALDKFSSDANEREELLLRALTAQQMEKNFLLVYQGIFGSQIRALRLLNERNIPRAEAENLLKVLKAEEPALGDWTLDQYLNFLLRWRLISVDAEQIVITETGRNFLIFLVQQGLSEDRPH